MTEEQKARAYDEALERMKSWVRGEHPECFTEAQKVAEFIFPELKESKKEWIEKIRQELKSYLGHRKIEQIAESDAVNQWIVWIEKQGEQSVEPDNNVVKLLFIEALERVEELNAKGYKLTDCDKNSWWEDFKGSFKQVLANSTKTCNDKRKPIWSEQDENKVKSLLGYLDTLVKYINYDAIVPIDLRKDSIKQVEQIETWFKNYINNLKN